MEQLSKFTPRHRQKLNHLCGERGFILKKLSNGYLLEKALYLDDTLAEEGQFVARTYTPSVRVSIAANRTFEVTKKASHARVLCLDEVKTWIAGAPLVGRKARAA